MNGEYLRDYELSIWTLQDTFINVLKWSGMEYRDANDEFLRKYPGIGQRGQIQNGEIKIVDDGTEELDFSVPKFYLVGGVKTPNPLWKYFEDNNFASDMYKVKIIFNKMEANERVFEFLLNSVEQTHENDEVTYDIHGTGLAFEELGKLGYKISLNSSDYEETYAEWFQYSLDEDMPLANIQYWNDKIFKDSEGNWKYRWKYRVEMDWSAFNNYLAQPRDSSKIYEETYISGWDNNLDDLLIPTQREDYREKSRQVDLQDSNIYNLTQSLAETFGVFCRYEYTYDENYHIVDKTVVYYNNQLVDRQGVIDLTYPYTMASATRSIDSKDIITKMFVRPIDSSEAASNLITIMNVDANKSREDYLLNFDYLHKIKTITDEQYAAIAPYEAEMHKINIDLMSYEFKIHELQNEINKLSAQETYYTNAIALDKERISDASALRDQLVDSETGYIERGDTNPLSLLVKVTTTDGVTSYSIKPTIQGIDPNSIHVYSKLDYAKKVGEGRLDGEIKKYKIVYDEFNTVSEITNLVFKNDIPTMVYVICLYSPRLYYDNVVNVWKQRLKKDQDGKQNVTKELQKKMLKLYGSMIDFGLVDYAVVDGMYEDDDEPLLALLPEQYFLLEEKAKKIAAFERMMGPALREGYWQPDTYNDYGNILTDQFSFSNRLIAPNSIPGTNNSNLIQLIWSEDKFEDEGGLVFDVGINTVSNAYLIVDLSQYLTSVAGHLDDLSFIYYDREIVGLLEQWDTVDWGSDAVKTEEKEYLLRKAMRSCSIHSGCEFGYTCTLNSLGEYQIIPILIITDIAGLSKEQLKWMLDVQNLNYQPCLGVLTSEYIPNTTIVDTKLVKLSGNSKLTFLNEYDDGNDRLVLKDIYSMKARSILTPANVTNYNNCGHYFPRLYVDTLEMKTDSDSFLMNINGQNLTMFEDYYILADTANEAQLAEGYTITIKPESLLRFGNNTVDIRVSFSVSNADISIYLDALKVMKENSTPKVSYSIKLNVLNERLIQEAYNQLNRIVHINDVELGFENVQGYISSITLNLDNPSEDTFEIKNYETKFEDLFSTIVAQTESMKKNENLITSMANTFTEGLIRGDVIQNTLLRTDLNYRFNQGKLSIDEKNGIWAISDEGIVAMRGGGIFTATQKDENGDWLWNTGILPSGINAALITTGQLDTNKIKIYAGDKVRFQLNGEGLFAYKSLMDNDAILEDATHSAADEALYNQYIQKVIESNNSKEIDSYQYVTFNEQGLFLVAKKGTWVLNATKDDYIQTAADVQRVAISWDGLVLRNWSGDKVFYADADTGDLTLSGNIETKSGHIGGWTITDSALTSDNIQLYSGNGSQSNLHGIYLTASESHAGLSTEVDGQTYWVYNNSNNSDNTDYYVKDIVQTSFTVSNTNIDKIFNFTTQTYAVTPKYIISEVDPNISTGNNIVIPGNADAGESSSTIDGNRTVNGLDVTVFVADENGNKLSYTQGGQTRYVTYDYSTSTDSTWYNILVTNNSASYVNYHTRQQLSAAQLSTGTTLSLKSFAPTFSVNAIDGAMTVNKGTIGSFTLDNEKLSNGKLNKVSISNDSTLYYGNSTVSLNEFRNCFSGLTSNPTTGQITLTRVDGPSVNFNIASLAYFQNQMAEAGRLTVNTYGYNNATAYVKMSTGYGNSTTQTVNISNVYTNGKNSVRIDTLGLQPGETINIGDTDIKVRAHATNEQTRDWTCNAINIYRGGYQSASGVVNRSRPQNNYTVEANKSWTITVPSGTDSSRIITVTGLPECFAGGSLVTLADGSQMPIEQLTLDKKLLGYDEETQQYKEININTVQVFRDRPNDMADVYLSTGEVICLTRSHPLLTEKGWSALDTQMAEYEHKIPIALLEEGDKLYSPIYDDVYITKITLRPDLIDIPVYNLDVEPYDTYIVENVVVHNADQK